MGGGGDLGEVSLQLDTNNHLQYPPMLNSPFITTMQSGNF